MRSRFIEAAFVGFLCLQAGSNAGVVGTIDTGGDVNVSVEFGSFSLELTGVLQQSSDLETWVDVDPAPASPVVVPGNGGSLFYRSRQP